MESGYCSWKLRQIHDLDSARNLHDARDCDAMSSESMTGIFLACALSDDGTPMRFAYKNLIWTSFEILGRPPFHASAAASVPVEIDGHASHRLSA
jgi:hypothetical protein